MGGLHRVDSREHSRPVPGQGTQCAEGLRLEVPGRRGGGVEVVVERKLASYYSSEDATAWQQAGLTPSLPGTPMSVFCQDGVLSAVARGLTLSQYLARRPPQEVCPWV